MEKKVEAFYCRLHFASGVFIRCECGFETGVYHGKTQRAEARKEFEAHASKKHPNLKLELT